MCGKYSWERMGDEQSEETCAVSVLEKRMNDCLGVMNQGELSNISPR